MTRADQEWLARQGGRTATRGGAVYDSTDPTLVPEKEAAFASLLADYVGAEFARLSSWRTRANVMVMADEADPLRSSKNPSGAIYVSRPAVYVNGSAIPTAYEIRNDTTVNPTVPADVTLSTDALTPEAKLVKWQISREQVDQVRSIAASDGADLTVPPGASAIDPFVARTLAAGAVKAAETWLMQGGVDGYPTGLLHEPSTNAQTATGNGLFELAKAIADTKARFRDPNLRSCLARRRALFPGHDRFRRPADLQSAATAVHRRRADRHEPTACP